MNKKELLECLKRLSTTNNKRDGIDIGKEEAQLIIETINNYKKLLDKIKIMFKEEAHEDGCEFCIELEKLLEEIK